MGGPSAWVGAAKSRSGWQRTEPSAQNQSRERGVGEPGTPASRALETRFLAAASAEERPPGAELSTAARSPPCSLCSRAKLGGAGHPLRSTGAQPPGDLAFQPQQVSPTSCGRCGAAVLGRFCTGRSTPGTRWVSGVVLDGCLPLYFCLPLPLSLYLSVSESVSFSNSLAYRICSGFVSLILFPPVFLGMFPRLCYFIFSAFSLSYLIFSLYFFFPSRCLSPLISPAWSSGPPPAPTTSSHILRLLVQGKTPRPSWAPPGTETSFLRARGD